MSDLQTRQENRRRWRAIEQGILERAKSQDGNLFLGTLTTEERAHIAELEAVRDHPQKDRRLLPIGHEVLAVVHRAQAQVGELPEASCNAILQAQARRERRAAKRRVKA